MMIRKMLFVLPLAAMMMLAGCGDDIPDDQSTPKAALEKFIAAVEAGNGDKMLEVVEASEEQKPMIRAMGSFFGASIDFEKAAKAKFGDEWKGGDNDMPGQEFADFKSKLDTVEVKEEGDKATLTMPGEKEPMHMVKKDGKWYIKDISEDMPKDPKEVEKAVKMMEAMTKAMKDVRPKIDEKGMTAEKLQQELGAAMMAAMMTTGMTIN